MKRAIIVHRWGGKPDDIWYPWVADQLLNQGYEVFLPEMPHTNTPTIGTWVQVLKDILADMSGEVVLIGHSIGCQTILRFLETLPDELRVSRCVFVAPWLMLKNLESDEAWEIAGPWLDQPIREDKVLVHAKDIRAIFSDNDPFVPHNNVKAFQNKFNAKTRVEKNMGHFEDEDLRELPPVIEELS